MKTNTIKRLVTIVAVAITIVMGGGSVYAGDNGDGTVTDGALVWLKNTNCFGNQDWYTATSSARSLSSGMCGLSDKSTAGQWRLPTKEELQRRQQNKSGFDIKADLYWSSNEYAYEGSPVAYFVSMYYGSVDYLNKSHTYGVWPVRAAQ